MANPFAEKNLAFFLTRNMSLKRWDANGMLPREVALYNLFARYFQNIYCFTYGDRNDLRYQAYLAPNVHIMPKKSKLPGLLYSFFVPLYHYPTLKKCHLFKSNQLDGAWSACLAKILSRKGAFILRTGFIWSLFLKQEKKFSSYPIQIIEKLLYRYCRLALVSSRADQKYLIKNYCLPPSRIKIVPNYVDTDLFRPLPGQKKFIKRIIYIGRLHPQKNLSRLIRALQNTGLALDIIGQGPLRAHLQKLARRLKVTVKMIGPVPHQELPFFLNQYRIFVLPSLYEGSPKSLLEAMACGLACVSTTLPNTQEIINDHQNGILTTPDVAALRQTIKGLVQNSQQQKELGQAARRYILQKHALTKLAKRELKIYAQTFKQYPT